VSTSGPTAETYVACLTPPGAAAIATLAVRGPRAWEAVRALFRPRSGSPPVNLEPGRFALGRLGQDLADEVVITLKQREPVPWVEVHCHGGPQVIRLLLEALETQGARSCSWQELEQRTNPDPLQALAAISLADARTSRTAAILLDQYHSAFSRAVAAVKAALVRGDVVEAGPLLESLARHADVGRHLTSPWRVVVAGAPNVGKSSLVNALAGFARCIVSATPGTTRDVVTTLLAVEGWLVDLADTAGLRTGTDRLEEEGIDRARRALADADRCLWVLDASAPPVFPDASLAADTVRLVVNKIDLHPAWDVDQAAGAVRVSARTGFGLGELCQSLGQLLVPDPPPPGAAVPFTDMLAERVSEAAGHVAAGRLDAARSALEFPVAAR
jgi:tRNA modification GTPase